MVSKYTSTSSEAPNPAPETFTVEVGGPTVGESRSPGFTVKLVELFPVPPGVVTEIGPVEAEAGTVAVIFVSEFTVKVAAAHGNQWVILEGLKPGEQVMVDGFQKLRGPGPVKPVPWQAAASAAAPAASR